MTLLAPCAQTPPSPLDGHRTWQTLGATDFACLRREAPDALARAVKATLAMMRLAEANLSELRGRARQNMGAGLALLLARGELGELERALVMEARPPAVGWLDVADPLEAVQAQTLDTDLLDAACALVIGLDPEAASKRGMNQEKVMVWALQAQSLLRPEGFDASELCRSVTRLYGDDASWENSHPLAQWLARAGGPTVPALSSAEFERHLRAAVALATSWCLKAAVTPGPHDPAPSAQPRRVPSTRVQAPTLLTVETAQALAEWACRFPEGAASTAEVGAAWAARFRALTPDPALSDVAHLAAVAAFRGSAWSHPPFGDLACTTSELYLLHRLPNKERQPGRLDITLSERLGADELRALEADLQALLPAFEALSVPSKREVASALGIPFIQGYMLTRQTLDLARPMLRLLGQLMVWGGADTLADLPPELQRALGHEPQMRRRGAAALEEDGLPF